MIVYKKIFFCILDVVVRKSRAVHRVFGCKVIQAEFKLELVTGLLQQGERHNGLGTSSPQPTSFSFPCCCCSSSGSYARGYTILIMEVCTLLEAALADRRRQRCLVFLISPSAQLHDSNSSIGFRKLTEFCKQIYFLFSTKVERNK